MRLWIVAAALAAGLPGLSACSVLDPSVAYPYSGWRTATGAPLTLAEVEALRISCRPGQISSPMDSDQPVASAIRDNPIYHPGGEGLSNARPTGIAAADRPLEPGTRRPVYTAAMLDTCLSDKGLLKNR
jgi:hypothetical protein